MSLNNNAIQGNTTALNELTNAIMRLANGVVNGGSSNLTTSEVMGQLANTLQRKGVDYGNGDYN
jgi:hypothetical protein